MVLFPSGKRSEKVVQVRREGRCHRPAWSARAWQEEKPALGDDVAKRHPELF